MINEKHHLSISKKVVFLNFERRPTTLNDRFKTFQAHIRNLGTKLYQNHALVEKKFFWSKMVNTLYVGHIKLRLSKIGMDILMIL